MDTSQRTLKIIDIANKELKEKQDQTQWYSRIVV